MLLVALQYKNKWDNTGNLYWEPVYQKLMETYNEVFEDIDMAGKGKVANGPGTYSSYKSMSVRFPTGVAFGSIDEDDESNDIAAAFIANIQETQNGTRGVLRCVPCYGQDQLTS